MEAGLQATPRSDDRHSETVTWMRLIRPRHAIRCNPRGPNPLPRGWLRRVGWNHIAAEWLRRAAAVACRTAATTYESNGLCRTGYACVNAAHRARGIRRFEVRTGGAAASFRMHTRRLYTNVHRTTVSIALACVTLALILRRFDPR
jgi:hypothetical protein